jgi:hypothetical protein
MGHAASAEDGWRAGHQHPQHDLAALARLAEARKSVLGPGEQLCQVRAGPNPETKKKDVVWFALNEERPLFAFAGSGRRGEEKEDRAAA